MECRLTWCVVSFGSQSYADVVRDRVAHEQHEAHLAVVGDFDCSGEDIERDWVDGLLELGDPGPAHLLLSDVRFVGSVQPSGQTLIDREFHSYGLGDSQ